MNQKAIFAIGGVFLGCMSNMIFLELLIREDPGIGTTVTFLQFVLISIHGIIVTSKFGTVKRYIELQDYGILVGMFFLSNICNNLAFAFNIPVPLHMIFRSGSLIANMIMGILILNKKYTLLKKLSVGMISLGIIIATLISNETKSDKTPDSIYVWIFGIALLTVALFISARMGIYQEWIYSHYGKHPMEALFYTHFLSLPWFTLFYSDIYTHMASSINGSYWHFPIVDINIPWIWICLLGNIFTQYICISSVYTLTTECSSLTVTLVVTLRKFASLVFSILYFKNPFTLLHWIATAMVFIGTFIFTEVPQKVYWSLRVKKQKKVD